MSEQIEPTPESPFSEEETEQIAVQQGIEALKRIHGIERQMLSRAIQELVGATGKSAEEVVSILAEGVDEDYENAMKSAYASARIVKPKLIIPR